mmetsp:Transcript_9583/g.25896  ORF Transcript_9583/g.25896 Transcript_9583/m.25896 type:complete len:219 (+) Transcript_9583:1370-2026(+)
MRPTLSPCRRGAATPSCPTPCPLPHWKSSLILQCMPPLAQLPIHTPLPNPSRRQRVAMPSPPSHWEELWLRVWTGQLQPLGGLQQRRPKGSGVHSKGVHVRRGTCASCLPSNAPWPPLWASPRRTPKAAAPKPPLSRRARSCRLSWSLQPMRTAAVQGHSSRSSPPRPLAACTSPCRARYRSRPQRRWRRGKGVLWRAGHAGCQTKGAPPRHSRRPME